MPMPIEAHWFCLYSALLDAALPALELALLVAVAEFAKAKDTR
jgi:hypothetical protein